MERIGKGVFAGFLTWGFLAVLAGCQTAPLVNVTNEPIETSRPVSLDEVGKSIAVAGAELGWRTRMAGPGNIEATLLLRKHKAVVDIAYSTTSYSITYKASENLEYQPAGAASGGAVIHDNYNDWVQNLRRAINAQLATLT